MLLLIMFSISVIGSGPSKLAQRIVSLRSAGKACELSKGLLQIGHIQKIHGTPTHHVHSPCTSPHLLIYNWADLGWPGLTLDSTYCPHFTDKEIIEEELFLKAQCWVMTGQCSELGSSNTYHGALSSGFQNISYFVKFYKIINFGKTISFLWKQSMSKI